MREEIEVVGAALEDQRLADVTRHGERCMMKHFYFVPDDSSTFGRAEVLHAICYGECPAITTGKRLTLLGHAEQDVFATREGSHVVFVQNFVAHRIEEAE